MAGHVDRRDAVDPEIPFEVRVDEGGDQRSRCAVHVDRHVGAGALLEVVERRGNLGDRLVASIERRPEDPDHPDRVLVAVRDRGLGVEVKAVALHRYEPRVDVPVVAELLPHHLDVRPHHQVRLLGR